MPLFNKYQTPNIYIPRTVLGAEDLVVKEIRKNRQRKRKLCSRSLINKEQMSKENKGNTMRAAIPPDQAESTGLVRDSASADLEDEHKGKGRRRGWSRKQTAQACERTGCGAR